MPKQIDWETISRNFVEIEMEWYDRLLAECPPAYHTEPDWDLPSVSIAYWQLMYDIYGWIPFPAQALVYRLVGERMANANVHYNRGTVMEPRQNGKTVGNTVLLYGAMTYLYPGTTAIFTDRTGAAAQEKAEADMMPAINNSDTFTRKWQPRPWRTGNPFDHRLRNGSRLYVPSSSMNPGRGATETSFAVLDEVLDDVDDRREAALGPTMTWALTPQLLRSSTPGYDHSGYLRRLVSRGRVACGGKPLEGNEDDVAGREQSNIRSFYVEFSAPEGEAWESEETWAKANPSWNYGMNLDVIRADFDSMDRETFCREHLGWWAVDGLNPAIPQEKWKAVKVETSEVTPPFAICLDSPPSGSNANVARSDGLTVEIDVRREGIAPTIRWVEGILEKYDHNIIIAVLLKSQMARVGELLENDGYRVVWYDTAMYAKATQRFEEAILADEGIRVVHHHALDKANNIACKKQLDIGFKVWWPQLGDKKDNQGKRLTKGDISAFIAATIAYDAIHVHLEERAKEDSIADLWDDARRTVKDSADDGELLTSIAGMWST